MNRVQVCVADLARLADASANTGGTAREAEEAKRKKYAHLSPRYRYEQVAFETSGSYGPTIR